MKLFEIGPLALEEMSFYRFFYFYLWRPFCSAERNHFSNFGRSSKEHSYDFFYKLVHWPRRRCCLKHFSTFRSDGRFVQLSGTIIAISKEHFCEIILKLAHWPRRRCCFMGFSIFSSGVHFVQRSGTILAILVEGHPRNISVKLF